MVVLIRRLKADQEETDYWDDDDLEEYEDEMEHLDDDIVEKPEPSTPEPEPEVETKKEEGESKEDLRARLAAEAKKTGIMQAAPGTEQGKTGWYIDSNGDLTSWLVSESGEWTRMS